jgi:tetratricopeptide (TPR) repeat protein
MAKGLEDWIVRCQNFVEESDNSPYLDGRFLELDEHAPKIGSSPEERHDYSEQAMRLLFEKPPDLGLRFGLLYPLRLSAIYNNHRSIRLDKLEEAKCFEHLFALCIPEELTDLRPLRFELHNSYLARQWNLTKQLLRQVELLDLVSPGDLAAIKGYLAFLAVFGGRLQFEQWNEEDYEFSWKWSIPEVAEEQFLSYTHPQIFHQGSIAHWVTTAWCVNPKAAKIVGWPPDPLDFSRPELPEIVSEVDRTTTVDSVLDSLRHDIHERYRDFEPIPPFVLNDEQRTQLVWSKRHLQDALTITPELGNQYRVLLARVLFSLGEFREAAEEYQRVLSQRFCFDHPNRTIKVGEDYEWELSFFTALCFRRAGDLDRAISVLQTVSPSGSSLRGASWWIAQWYSEEGFFDKAAEFLVKESEQPYFSPPESWQLSTVLALARLSRKEDERDQAERFLERLKRRNPEMVELIVGLSAQLWPSFSLLAKESQAHWLLGVAELHISTFPGAEGASANRAITAFAWIVEHELRTKLFDTFRPLPDDRVAREKIRKDSLEWPQDKFMKFLLSAKLEITFGIMTAALDDCLSSRVPTHNDFRRHVERISGSVLDHRSELKVIKQFRDATVHPSKHFKRDDALKLARACKDVLNRMMSVP